MRVVRCEILEVDIPFKLTFKHSLHERSESNSIILKLHSDTGEVGWGESLPRDYVTGETMESVVATISESLLPILLDRHVGAWEEALDCARNLEVEARRRNPDLPARIGAARCALELAFLDLAGNHFRRSVAEIFGSRKREWVEYSGVISSDSRWKVIKTSAKMRLGGLRAIKVKVGGGDDKERLKWIRRMAGPKVDLRVDANAAWKVSDAIGRIQAFRQFGITSVEQPVGAEDIAGLQAVTAAVSTPIMVDESLCTMADAKKLVAMDACDYFNIRLSKCGGLFASLDLAEFARNHDKGCQLGCQVGETAILSSAGRHFALGVAGLKYFEGSFGTHLLEHDVAKENMTFRSGGVGKPLTGPGLGIHVFPERVDPHVRKRHEIEASK
jgi:muconate cycloisomerase